jgi:hypothetical protein
MPHRVPREAEEALQMRKDRRTLSGYGTPPHLPAPLPVGARGAAIELDFNFFTASLSRVAMTPTLKFSRRSWEIASCRHRHSHFQMSTYLASYSGNKIPYRCRQSHTRASPSLRSENHSCICRPRGNETFSRLLRYDLVPVVGVRLGREGRF